MAVFVFVSCVHFYWYLYLYFICICICGCICPTCDCCDCCDRLNGIIGGNLIEGSGNTVSGQTTSGHHTLVILPRSDFYQPALRWVCNHVLLILLYTELNYSTEGVQTTALWYNELNMSVVQDHCGPLDLEGSESMPGGLTVSFLWPSVLHSFSKVHNVKRYHSIKSFLHILGLSQ